MFENIENIRLTYFVSSEATNTQIENRKTHMFVFRTEGSGIFDFGDRTIESPEKSLIFIPKDSSYKFTVTSSGACSSMRINFLADIDNPLPKRYSLKGFADANKIIFSAVNLWKKHNPASKHQCISLFHSLISFLINAEQEEYLDKGKYKLIKPAIEYLNEHFLEPSFSIDTLPRLCRISPSYFRKIFYSYFKTSPGKYVEEKRLNQANMIIESGDFNTIYEVSKSVGYNDPLYFGKVFKKKFGFSPSHIHKK